MNNIFKQHAAISAEQQSNRDATTFLELASFMDIHGLEDTRAGISNCIEAAIYLNDQAAVFFYSFALNELHS